MTKNHLKCWPTNSQIVMAFLNDHKELSVVRLQELTAGLLSTRGLHGTLEQLRQKRRVERFELAGVAQFRCMPESAK